MANTAKKTAIKRKRPRSKPARAKKPKLENATSEKPKCTPKAKQKAFPKVKREASSKKPSVPKVKTKKKAGAKSRNKGKPNVVGIKPFAGTKSIKREIDGACKKVKSTKRSLLKSLKRKLNDPAAKVEVIALLEQKIQEIEARDYPLSKTARKKIRMFRRWIERAMDNSRPVKHAQNGKLAKNVKSAAMQKRVEKREEEDEEVEDDDDVSVEEEEGDSDAEEVDSGEEEEDDEEDDDEDEEEDSDEDDTYRESDKEEKKFPKVSNKRLKKQFAMMMTNEEQISGNYKNAYDMFFTMCQQLKQNGIKTPSEMCATFMLLH